MANSNPTEEEIPSTEENIRLLSHWLVQFPKLPAIEIKKFSGNEEDWHSFFELFNTVIHGNPRLKDVTRLQYLMSYLEKGPLSLIDHLTLSNANYASAISILKTRYESKRILVASYVKPLVRYKKFKIYPAEDVIGLHDRINVSLTGLKNLQYDISSWDPLIVSIAMNKFDSETAKAFEETLPDTTTVPSLEELQNFLTRRYRILKAIGNNSKSN
ncbi:uncharacterized protein LOC129806710 [Phlebotomus papatasi]|uniref:uncharacterized protein LOC129806710 n=1 Tax=Phlebotomus papatasi TaxID=29031 RepID=UPI0024841F1A|nr:uncharacterized protein LOC129806710 [Phlebotomus papatasi]